VDGQWSLQLTKKTRFQNNNNNPLFILVVTVKQIPFRTNKNNNNNNFTTNSNYKVQPIHSFQPHFFFLLKISTFFHNKCYTMENPTSTRNSDSLSATLFNSIQALGRGFDVTSDIRLLYCKGAPGSRLVHLDEQHTRDLVLSQQLVVPDVSLDIDFSNGTSGIHKTPVYSFQEVILLFLFFFFWILILFC
jgi:hypothetical protein